VATTSVTCTAEAAAAAAAAGGAGYDKSLKPKASICPLMHNQQLAWLPYYIKLFEHEESVCVGPWDATVISS
jgi:hypothetical protein